MEVNLSNIKRERKYLEQDAQLLANRIKLLQQEDEKTWKKIQETRKKARKLALIQKEQEERMILNQEIKQERERALSEKRSNNQKIREMQKRQRSDMRSAIFNSKQEAAFYVKNQREANLREIQYKMSSLKEENQMRKASVNRDKMVGKSKIIEFQRKRSSIGREMYWKKIEDNEKVKTEKILEVENMERLEIELVKRLQNTQFIREHANQELESLIKSPGMSSIYSSILSRNKLSY